MSDLVIALLVIFGLLLFIVSMNMKIVPEHKAIVVERFGVFYKIIDQPGIHFLIPIIERVSQTVSLIEEQKIFHFMHKNEKVEFSYFYKVIDIKLFVYGALDALKVIHREIEALYHQDTMLYTDSLQTVIDMGLLYGIEIRMITKHN